MNSGTWRRLLVVTVALTLGSIHWALEHVYAPWAIERAYEWQLVQRDGEWVPPDPPSSEDSFEDLLVRSLARGTAPLVFIPGVGNMLPGRNAHGPPYSRSGNIVWAVFWLANVVFWWAALSVMAWGFRRLRRRH